MKSLVFEARRTGELGTGAHAKLAVDVPQVELDCLLRQEQLRGRLPVRETCRDELGYPVLGRR